MEFQEAMETVGLSSYLSEYAKLLVINKNVCDDYIDSVKWYLELMVSFFSGRPERSKVFTRLGGQKRLKSVPKFLLEQP